MYFISHLPETPQADMLVAVKDNICTKDLPTTCASKMMGKYMSPFDATVIERLKSAGAVVVGKTNMDEFAMGCTGEASHVGAVKNPHNEAHVAGGSSSGSAAAVAAGEVHYALGSDTGGSIRTPAAHCGVVGFKPSYGTVSRFGLVACAPSMDQIGPITNTVEDCVAMMNIIAGHDAKDAMTLPGKLDYSLDGNIAGKKIALPKECFGDHVSRETKVLVLAAVEVLKSLGAVVEEISLPLFEYAMPVYQIICAAEATSSLARFDGVKLGHRAAHGDNLNEMYCMNRGEGFGDEVKKRILLGTTVLSSDGYDIYYKKAAQVRALIKQELDQALETYDALLTPTTPFTAPKFGENKDVNADVFTCPANLAGLPAISIPCGKDAQGLPVGMQLIGGHLGDATVLNLGHAYEQEVRA